MSYLNPAPPNLNTTQLSVPQLSVAALVSQYVLDQLSAFPAVAYSVRLLTATYSGACMNVRRSSDNTAMDIGFVNGWLDTVTLLNFVGSGNGFVTKWYNQGSLGSSGDASQSTAASQPQIVASGVLETWNGQPAVYFGGSEYLVTAGNVQVVNASTGVWSAAAVANTAATQTQALIANDTGSSPNRIWSIRSNANANRSYVVNYGATEAGTFLTSSVYPGNLFGGSLSAGSILTAYSNGNSGGTAAVSGGNNLNSDVLSLGSISQSYYLIGTISEAWAGGFVQSASDKAIYDLNTASPSVFNISGVTQ